MTTRPSLYINGIRTAYESERNLLEVIRNAHIDLPTFCYHSELSVYGACRLCIVEVEGRGIVSACSTRPEPGLRITTATSELREIRRISLELLLANHDQHCTSCVKSSSCKLQTVARRLGVTDVRFARVEQHAPVDLSTAGIRRDANKCILCGDCVRACHEIQGIGAIDFAFRGHSMTVAPSFGSDLGDATCVECGQCARVCPTGALTPRYDVDRFWNAVERKGTVVVAQIAPAVRAALGEYFGLPPGTDVTGQTVAALRLLGVQRVYDTSFAADLTVIEETNEFLHRAMNGGPLPIITSCCPAWVRYAEYHFPEMLPHLSTCRSPQQMLGSVVKQVLPKELNVHREDVVMVSVMPCTAKRAEAEREEFSTAGSPDVDIVITTQELGAMIEQAGLDFRSLEPRSFDLPFGFRTGAGVLFGNSGGVSEAVLRHTAQKLSGTPIDEEQLTEVRGDSGIRNVTLTIGGKELRLSIVHGLRNARHLLNEVKKGTVLADIIEVMSCPGGCVGGGGQPVSYDPSVRRERAKALRRNDRSQSHHSSQENPYLAPLYDSLLGEPGSAEAHHLLHTSYTDRSEAFSGEVVLSGGATDGRVEVKVCLGPKCLSHGSDDLLASLVDHVATEGLTGDVVIVAHHNVDPCEHGITVHVDGEPMDGATLPVVVSRIADRLQRVRETS